MGTRKSPALLKDYYPPSLRIIEPAKLAILRLLTPASSCIIQVQILPLEGPRSLGIVPYALARTNQMFTGNPFKTYPGRFMSQQISMSPDVTKGIAPYLRFFCCCYKKVAMTFRPQKGTHFKKGNRLKKQQFSGRRVFLGGD